MGDSISAGVAHSQCNSEVGNYRLTGLHENVLRLQVAVDYAVRVRVIEGVRDCDGNPNCFVDGKLLLTIQPCSKRLSIHKRHYVVEKTVRGSRIEKRKKIRVLKIRRNSDFREKPLWTEHGAELRIQEFEGDRPLVTQILREINRRHSTGANFALDVVTIR